MHSPKLLHQAWTRRAVPVLEDPLSTVTQRCPFASRASTIQTKNTKTQIKHIFCHQRNVSSYAYAYFNVFSVVKRGVELFQLRKGNYGMISVNHVVRVVTCKLFDKTKVWYTCGTERTWGHLILHTSCWTSGKFEQIYAQSSLATKSLVGEFAVILSWKTFSGKCPLSTHALVLYVNISVSKVCVHFDIVYIV